MRDGALLNDYAATLDQYVDDVLADRVVACRFVKLACARHRRDLERAADGGPWVFDVDAANLICAFEETFPHIEGEWAARGETIKLEPWQVFILGSVNGWRCRETGYRRFRTVYIEVARKNAKSTMTAPVALFALTMDGEAGAKVFTAATKMSQARIVYETALAMTRRNRLFVREFGLKAEEHRIKSLDGTTQLRPVEAKRLDGKNVHCAIVDELHEHQNSGVWDSLDQGRGSRRQSLLWAITTAGQDIAGVCFEKRDYLIKILEQIFEDDTWFGAIWTLDDGDDPFDETVWSKANPNLGVSKMLDYMRAQALAARGSAGAKGTFLRKDLNIWTAAGVTAFDPDDWRACEVADLEREDFAGRGGVTTIDLALKHDMSAVATILDLDGLIHLFIDIFATEATVMAEGAERLKDWAESGHIHVCPGHMMDFDSVEACAREHAALFGSERIGYDPHYAASMAMSLADDFEVVEVRNTSMTLDQPFQRLQGEIANHTARIEPNPVLAWMASNTVVRAARNGFQMPDKTRPANKIDGISAACMALALLDAPAEESAGPTHIPADYVIG